MLRTRARIVAVANAAAADPLTPADGAAAGANARDGHRCASPNVAARAMATAMAHSKPVAVEYAAGRPKRLGGGGGSRGGDATSAHVAAAHAEPAKLLLDELNNTKPSGWTGFSTISYKRPCEPDEPGPQGAVLMHFLSRALDHDDGGFALKGGSDGLGFLFLYEV